MNMDKAKHTGEELLGKAKEAAGKVTGNSSLEAEGTAEQLKAKAKQVGDDIKDAFSGDDKK
ncbi:CsbD-like protein [Microcella putealis]|uniref:CsbD-like protein n=1 Tax=Microcella putealis TaxID=337005 RepID=A0A4Q7LQA9_9MICO|nr:CsbD family protein [Microcella putealis]RZS56277.1 CsbD-like protein [Microcella putealis]TQM27237.1 CsbD-like protein [Microcella putealis]